MKPTVFRPLLPGFRSLFDEFLRPMPGFREEEDLMSMPAVNVRETETHFHLEVAAPGLCKEDFKVTVENGVLTVSAEKRKSGEDKTDNYTRREFRYASFRRSFQMPEGVREEDIKASYTNGVLVLDLPRHPAAPETKGRAIEIG
jgi:HSP20 family protein